MNQRSNAQLSKRSTLTLEGGRLKLHWKRDGDDISVSDMVRFLGSMGLICQDVLMADDCCLILKPMYDGLRDDKLSEAEHLINDIKNCEIDDANVLVLYSSLLKSEIMIVCAYAGYLKQVGFINDSKEVVKGCIKHPQAIEGIINRFNELLSPNKGTAKKAEIDWVSITSSRDYEIFSALLALVQATTRTNFFTQKDHIALKLDGTQLSFIPDPKPFREIYVYARDFEAVHLRAGKVGRGGIRWSDREDYRTEILDLMKTQTVKNSIVVPTGAKGGFFIKTSSAEGEQKAIECYKKFLGALLELSDNITHDGVKSSPGIVVREEADPYIVVAADKGTAAFSDIANSIALERGFWLGDATASGGSSGYNHKAMGITARGVWVAVKQHFKRLDIDVNKPFSMVGIGDLSGDLFGNGLLLSRQMKLIAAFNHKHIFIDPEPDLAASYAERERMFKLPRSQWSDYDTKVISEGGGVYSRGATMIELHPKAQKALGIQNSSLTPDDLIKAILCAPVDVLWNGGIGTYVKSKTEAHTEAKDRGNDGVRVNGNDLRCRVVAEGGNLGFTQKGRIEYSDKGGALNTDAIDNSGGVDCSDHEVNIKIALSKPLADGLITEEERRTLLSQATQDVALAVLGNNEQQNLILSLEEQTARSSLDAHIHFLTQLGERMKLEPNLVLRDEERALLERAGKGLSRPFLALLLAYAKNSAAEDLQSINIPLNRYYSELLISYFPPGLRVSKFVPYIEKHILQQEILGTIIVNDFVNSLGIIFWHRLRELGYDVSQIIAAFAVVQKGLKSKEIWTKIEQANLPHAQAMVLLKALQEAMKENILLLINEATLDKVDRMIEDYSKLSSLVMNGLVENSHTIADLTMLTNVYAVLLEVNTITKNLNLDHGPVLQICLNLKKTLNSLSSSASEMRLQPETVRAMGILMREVKSDFNTLLMKQLQKGFYGDVFSDLVASTHLASGDILANLVLLKSSINQKIIAL